MRTPGVTKIRSGTKKSSSQLSLVAAFDELCRNQAILNEGQSQAEEQMLVLVKKAQGWRREFRMIKAERAQALSQVVEKDNELSGKLMQIKQARNYLQEERAARIKAEQERDNLQKQLRLIQDLVFSDRGHHTLSNETLVKIRTLDRHASTASQVGQPPAAGSPAGNRDNHGNNPLPVVDETAESLLDFDDLSFEDTREDVMGDTSGRQYRQTRRSAHNTSRQQRRKSSFAKRKSHERDGGNIFPSNIVVANNNLATRADISPDRVLDIKEKVRRSRLAAAAPIEEDDEDFHTPVAAAARQTPAVTPSTVKRTFSNASAVAGNRPHSFQKKNGLMSERCNPCGKRIKFGKTVFKCRDCGVAAHEQCKKDVPLPCIAGGSRTPQNKATGAYLADFTPIEAPMIPAILIYCVKEIEARGMDDVGIYRVAGSESEANEILDKFRRGGPPRLSKYEIHAVTSCLKKFLRQLKEPVIPLSLWQVFVDAANNPDTTDSETAMYQAISELPQPNRDTLSYLVVHLQAVASNSKTNKMNVDNLAMVMGPTLVGNSSNDPMAIMAEAGLQKGVVRALMAISGDYWSQFLAVEDDKLMLRAGPGPGAAASTTAALSPAMTPDQAIFATPLAGGLTTGGPARRTRSKHYQAEDFSKKQQLFQSPMLL